MQAIKDLAKKYGVTASLVGGGLVVGSVFGQCTLSPPEVLEAPSEEAPEEEAAEEAPAKAEEVEAEEPTDAPDAE